MRRVRGSDGHAEGMEAEHAHRVSGGRLRDGLVAAWAALSGVAPHVLHHVGPLAGTALVAGAGGRLLFGVVGLLLTVPTLRRLHRRFDSWTAPALALVAFAAVFSLSAFVIGPRISGSDGPEAAEDPEHVEHGHTASPAATP